MAGLRDGFNERLGGLLERHDELLSDLSYEAAKALGAQGADAAVAPLIWAAAVGDRWPTSTVTEFLHVTRQALHKRLAKGTILGLPGNGTTWFPVWQFDVDAREVRPTVAEVIAAFREELGSRPVPRRLVGHQPTARTQDVAGGLAGLGEGSGGGGPRRPPGGGRIGPVTLPARRGIRRSWRTSRSGRSPPTSPTPGSTTTVSSPSGSVSAASAASTRPPAGRSARATSPAIPSGHSSRSSGA
jgi:hypothetical protein